MKYLIPCLFVTSLLISCSDNWNDQVVEPLEASGGWSGGPAWIMTFQEFMNTPGNIYFEDNNGLIYPLKDGVFVCPEDYPDLEFELVEISNYAEYEGTLADANGNEIHASNGEISLVEFNDVLQQRQCYTATVFDPAPCEFGGTKLCWTKITYCKEPWEIVFHQVSVEQGCDYCGPIFKAPFCIDLG